MARKRFRGSDRYGARVMGSYLNLSRRLVRWLKNIQMARTALRMRYVRLFHAYQVLMGNCSHDALIDAMQMLLNGWSRSDEGDETQPYYALLREAIAELEQGIAACMQVQVL